MGPTMQDLRVFSEFHSNGKLFIGVINIMRVAYIKKLT